MLSSNSHMLKPALRLAAAVTLLLGSAAQAGDSAHNFQLTAYSNGKGGSELVSGDYAAAGKALHYRNSTLNKSDVGITSNNRCVMLTVTKQWDSARAACDQAVRDAQQEKAMLPSYQYWARKFQNDYLAVALSNRAVFHWMSADSEAAADDLKRAAALSPKASFVTHNQQALELSHAKVAQVSVAPASN